MFWRLWYLCSSVIFKRATFSNLSIEAGCSHQVRRSKSHRENVLMVSKPLQREDIHSCVEDSVQLSVYLSLSFQFDDNIRDYRSGWNTDYYSYVKPQVFVTVHRCRQLTLCKK